MFEKDWTYSIDDNAEKVIKALRLKAGRSKLALLRKTGKAVCRV